MYNLVPMMMLIVATFPLPYGYYTMLRIIITIFALFNMIYIYRYSTKILIILLFIATLFNPIIKVSFPKDYWFYIDIVTACFFLLLAIDSKKKFIKSRIR